MSAEKKTESMLVVTVLALTLFAHGQTNVTVLTTNELGSVVQVKGVVTCISVKGFIIKSPIAGNHYRVTVGTGIVANVALSLMTPLRPSSSMVYQSGVPGKSALYWSRASGHAAAALGDKQYRPGERDILTCGATVTITGRARKVRDELFVEAETFTSSRGGGVLNTAPQNIKGNQHSIQNQ